MGTPIYTGFTIRDAKVRHQKFKVREKVDLKGFLIDTRFRIGSQSMSADAPVYKLGRPG